MEKILRLKYNKIFVLFTMLAMMTWVIYTPTPANATTGQFVLGGLAGAGIVLAWPTIVAGLGAAAGGVACAVGAVSGVVATGGAAIGGAVAGAGAAVGGAVTGAFGAIGGAIAAVTASPLFVPALLITGAVVAGYFVYKHFKKKSSKKGPLRISDTNYGHPTKNHGCRIIPSSSGGRTTKNHGTTFIPTKNHRTRIIPTKNHGCDNISGIERRDSNDYNVRYAYEKYQSAYKRYIICIKRDCHGTNPETLRALKELRSSETYYRKAVRKQSK